jgi:hypothetical protein
LVLAIFSRECLAGTAHHIVVEFLDHVF